MSWLQEVFEPGPWSAQFTDAERLRLYVCVSTSSLKIIVLADLATDFSSQNAIKI